jgi:deazaflavin-dependent oxidoreductase (nitroreductase family)
MISRTTTPSSGSPRVRRVRETLQTWLYRYTGGILGYHFTRDSFSGHRGPVRILLLSTTPGVMGTVNTIPLAYFKDGQDFFVLAFHEGSLLQPTWYLNLKAHPQAEIQIKTRHQPVTGTIATTEERSRLFGQLTSLAPNYARYQQGTSREVPVALLHTA